MKIRRMFYNEWISYNQQHLSDTSNLRQSVGKSPHRNDISQRQLHLANRENRKNIFGVVQSIVRAYGPVKGKEITFWIGTEGAAVVLLKSYINNEQGYETVECMKNTQLYPPRRNTLEMLFAEDIHIAN